MYYFTLKASPRMHQMTLEEFWEGVSKNVIWYNPNETNTRTWEVEKISEDIKARFDIGHMIARLKEFCETHKRLIAVENKADMYYTFHIPKASGGFRRIDAPNDELKTALSELKVIFENDIGGGYLYHTSAFAYIKGRCTIDSVKRHQENESKWFGKYDISNFFGSTTKEFVLKMFGMIFPFCVIMNDKDGKAALESALDLAFLNGGLPQGTPLSPTITNIMMIPVDFNIARTLRDYNEQRYVYTRYADDFLVSSKYLFKVKEIEKVIVDTLAKFDAPFTINAKKTRLGSSSGSNWNLGVMLNGENKITVGYKAKRQLITALHSYIQWKQTGVGDWTLNDIQIIQGKISYFKMVEGDKAINDIIKKVCDKHNFDVMASIKKDLKEM